MRSLSAALLGVLVLSSACTAPAAVPPAPLPGPLAAFSATEVAWAQGAGSATIEGQAFLKTRGGDVKYAAGNVVMLLPNTAQSFDYYARKLGGHWGGNLDPALAALVRTTIAGGDGHFKFEDLPAGPYLILTTVRWEAPSSYGLLPQGGYVGAAVTAVSGKTTNIIVTE